MPALLFIILVLYFLPAILAVARKLPAIGLVIVANFVIGWAFLGWLLSRAMVGPEEAAPYTGA